MSDAFCGNRGYVAIHSAATEALSVEKVIVPPPRNKKPTAELTAACAPYDNPETPPDPPVAAAAAAAAAPPAVADAPPGWFAPPVSTRMRSLLSTRNVSTSPVPAITHASATAATHTHVSAVGRSTSSPHGSPAAAAAFNARKRESIFRSASRAATSAVPAKRSPSAMHAPASACTCACASASRSLPSSAGKASKHVPSFGDFSTEPSEPKRASSKKALPFIRNNGGRSSGGKRVSIHDTLGSTSCHMMSALATTRVSTKSGRTWSSA